jgi:hypothetical protein
MTNFLQVFSFKVVQGLIPEACFVGRDWSES